MLYDRTEAGLHRAGVVRREARAGIRLALKLAIRVTLRSVDLKVQVAQSELSRSGSSLAANLMAVQIAER